MSGPGLLRRTLATLLILQLLACGTLLYPERRGQTSGQYDADVVLLDAAGLLLFIIPGVIAFAVDILTGAIYLPPGEESKIIKRLGEAGPIQLDPANPDPELLARAVEERLGLRIGRIRVLDGAESCAVDACLARYGRRVRPADHEAPGKRHVDPAG
jgi:hypothetical protein